MTQDYEPHTVRGVLVDIQPDAEPKDGWRIHLSNHNHNVASHTLRIPHIGKNDQVKVQMLVVELIDSCFLELDGGVLASRVVRDNRNLMTMLDWALDRAKSVAKLENLVIYYALTQCGKVFESNLPRTELGRIAHVASECEV